MSVKTYPFDPARYLDTPDAVAAFMEEAFETGDASRSPLAQRVDRPVCGLVAQKSQVGILVVR